MRSKIRIEDGRAKPIDLLAKYISSDDNDVSVEVHEPYTYLNGLTIDDLEDLLEDIKVYTELEQGRNQDFWRDITTVTEDELARLRKMDPTTQEMYLRDRREGIHQAVSSEVTTVFKGKSLAQLQLLGDQIRKKLRLAATGDLDGATIDVGYWESLLQQLGAHMARTRLRERHQELLKQKLARLKQEQGIEADLDEGSQDSSAPGTSAAFARPAVPDRPPVVVKAEPSSATEQASSEPRPAAASTTVKAAPASGQEDEAVVDADLVTPDDGREDAAAEAECDPYDVAKYSPRLLSAGEIEEGVLVYNAEEDIQRLEYLRKQVLRTGKAQTDTDGEYIKKAREGMSSDEAQFSVQVPIEQQAFLWSDKYRPRKPRFFNRVHTGFEWNKYNQTHYDMDNPPPKIVQGYKFNIFYPDLIDKTKTPEYTITPIEEEQDFCVLRFHAGPPYEDIAFKIVNREWEHSYKRGFKCQFHNNIFQLWFHFKRYRYRR